MVMWQFFFFVRMNAADVLNCPECLTSVKTPDQHVPFVCI